MPKPILIEFFGAPCVGKTAVAPGVFSILKRKGLDCEFVREAAQEIIFNKRLHLFNYQMSLLQRQFEAYYERILAGATIVISDSAMVLPSYYQSMKQNTELANLMGKVSSIYYSNFITYKVFVKRNPNIKYSDKARLHSEAESQNIAEDLERLYQPFNFISDFEQDEGIIELSKDIQTFIESNSNG